MIPCLESPAGARHHSDMPDRRRRLLPVNREKGRCGKGVRGVSLRWGATFPLPSLPRRGRAWAEAWAGVLVDERFGGDVQSVPCREQGTKPSPLGEGSRSFAPRRGASAKVGRGLSPGQSGPLDCLAGRSQLATTHWVVVPGLARPLLTPSPRSPKASGAAGIQGALSSPRRGEGRRCAVALALWPPCSPSSSIRIRHPRECGGPATAAVCSGIDVVPAAGFHGFSPARD